MFTVVDRMMMVPFGQGFLETTQEIVLSHMMWKAVDNPAVVVAAIGVAWIVP